MEVACGTRKEVQVFGSDYDTHDGTGVRDYIHVTDLADADALALDHLAAGKGSFVVNLGTGKGHSVLDVVKATESVTGRAVAHRIVPRREGDPAALWATGDKARTLLGWEPKHSSIEEILQTTWSAYRANGLG